MSLNGDLDLSTTNPFDISFANGRLEIRCSDVCSRLAAIDAKNLVATLKRTLNVNAKLQVGERLCLTTSEIELHNFSEFVNFKFSVNGESGLKEAYVQINKEQVPALISTLSQHIDKHLSSITR